MSASLLRCSDCDYVYGKVIPEPLSDVVSVLLLGLHAMESFSWEFADYSFL